MIENTEAKSVLKLLHTLYLNDRETEFFQPLCSHSKRPDKQIKWPRLKSGARHSISDSHKGDRDPTTLTIVCYLPRVHTGNRRTVFKPDT